jgi:large subunit ribosomal protein L23
MSSILNYDKIKGLVYTEKTNKQLADSNKYTFEIDPECTKKEVASLIKKSFNVEVVKVNIANIRAENRKFKGVAGRTKARKKAVVTLKEGNTIDFN